MKNLVGFKFGDGTSKKNGKPFYYVDIHFNDKWYKRVFLTAKQYEILRNVTITVID